MWTLSSGLSVGFPLQFDRTVVVDVEVVVGVVVVVVVVGVVVVWENF